MAQTLRNVWGRTMKDGGCQGLGQGFVILHGWGAEGRKHLIAEGSSWT